MFNINNFMYVH